MKRFGIQKTVLLIVLMIFCAHSVYSATISGQVTDAATGEPLPGANVLIKGTSIGAATNVEGEYSIPRVPPGNFTLLVKYIGYQDKSETINIISGRNLEKDFALEFVTIEGEMVEITAQAEGQIAAINQQLSARTITNVVASDRIKEIPDDNAAESVGRLPGISIIRSGGEGAKVVIRGLSPKYNVMMVNGVRMQSTDRNDRSVDLNMISPNMLSGIEVTKALTADMDADAVGGVVNLRIDKAKDGFHVDVTSQGGYGSMVEEFKNFRFYGGISNRFYKNKLGVQVTASIDEFDRSSDALNAGYTTNEETTTIEGLAEIDLASVTITDIASSRKRKGAGFVMDYQFNNGSLLFSNFISDLNSKSVTMRNELNVDGYQFDCYTTEAEGTTTVYNNTLQGDYKLWDMDIDFSLANSVSKMDVPGDLTMRVIPEQDQAGFTTDLGAKAIDATPSEFLNSVNFIADDLRTKRLESNERDVTVAEQNAMLNVSLPYRFTNYLSGKIKFGAKYRISKRENDETLYFINPDRHTPSQTFTRMMIDSLWTDLGLNAIDTGNGIRAFLFENPNYDVGNFLAGKEGIENDKFYYTGSLLRMNQYEGLARKWDRFFKESRESNQYDYTYDDDITAFYLMTEMDIGKYVTFIPGIRYESMNIKYDAWGTTYVGPEFYDFYNEKVKLDKTEENWFPQMHLRIKPFDWLDVRLASTKSIIYPDYRAMSPYYYFSSGSPSISMGNPTLSPAIAQNYDVYTSIYDNYIGLFTIGFFQKEMDDLITTSRFYTMDAERIFNTVVIPQNKNTTVDTWINLQDQSTVKGFEVDWQTNFWYLPGILRSIVFSINYSHMDSETRFPYQFVRKEGTGIFAKSVFVDSTRSGRMPNQSNDILNSTVGFDYRGFSMRLSFLYQGNTLNSASGREELDPYTDDYYRWDLIINQKLPWHGLELYSNIKNLTNRPDRYFVSKFELLSSAVYTGSTADVGLRFRF